MISPSLQQPMEEMDVGKLRRSDHHHRVTDTPSLPPSFRMEDLPTVTSIPSVFFLYIESNRNKVFTKILPYIVASCFFRVRPNVYGILHNFFSSSVGHQLVIKDYKTPGETTTKKYIVCMCSNFSFKYMHFHVIVSTSGNYF